MRTFYEDFLGLVVENDLGSCIVYRNNLTLWQVKDDYPIAQELGYTYEHIGNRNLELAFLTDQFGDVVEKVLMSELRILHNAVEEEWGQYTIRFYDPEGNLIEIGESMSAQVIRMHENGANLEEIVMKSGYPRIDVERILQ